MSLCRNKAGTHSMVVFLLSDIAVAVTPVKGHFFLLLLIEPDELLRCPGHKVTETLQVPLSIPRAVLMDDTKVTSRSVLMDS